VIDWLPPVPVPEEPGGEADHEHHEAAA